MAGGTVAEKLVQSFLVIRDFVFFDQRNEIGGRVACDGGLGEMRIGREEVLRAGMKIGEVAASAAGNEDFLAEAVSTFEYGDAAAALSRLDGAHEAGGAPAGHDAVKGVGHATPGAKALPSLPRLWPASSRSLPHTR